MNHLLQGAIERRESLRRELEAIEAFIIALTSQASAKTELRESGQTELFEPRAPSRSERAAMTTAMMDDAERIILDAGRPLTRFVLLERLESMGYRIVGADKSKVLGTNLWRSTRFHNIKKAGYWPKSHPIPAPYDTLPRRSSMLS